MLREHGPDGAVFHRFGRSGFQTLVDAIGNPRRDTALARLRKEEAAKAAEYKAEQQRLAEEKEREREARRPVCTGCGTRFTDTRWEAVQASDWGQKRDKHPKLCEDCKAKAIQTKRDEAAAAKKKQKEEAAEAERKAKRPFARFRT
ncbi:hypothetical protein HRW23_34985 [Streptomyces lunaelactis]|uniref:hypothetical protein n=1 Tax=Streptomyces lunaelactis TaxID=1535768 RepID=UPI0015850280|nr:hypothetical protein [Streptomyces lunaelactis]NUK12609.1 hypothetical protein [Streptomyces lunaelactis]NUK38916.1 hypothetical protein [Streptomyces lunaelactis]NUK46020.1 hypothetical protein [Streptomyces lunaelactis]NUK61984.1 hypothetical protein [Streptomyces lunaelactis]NUK71012.1 hypothetical protein [Streptomyces lunaelactis]